MFAACGWDLFKTIHPGHDARPQPGLTPSSISGQQWIVLAIRVLVVSFFVCLGRWWRGS